MLPPRSSHPLPPSSRTAVPLTPVMSRTGTGLMVPTSFPFLRASHWLELMWSGFKDKTPVSLRHFKATDFTTNSHCVPDPPTYRCDQLIGSRFLPGLQSKSGTGHPSIDWVEGMVIVIATFIIVCCFSLSPDLLCAHPTCRR